MRMADIIEHKKQGLALTKEEIEFFVKEYTNGDIPDYQASALAMAIYFNKMTNEETAALTLAMAKSGDMLDLSEFKNSTVDKHSSGGVGDKTTLVVAPIAAAAGCTVAKMSGRGLGFTGGTIDKLEAIPGFCTAMSSTTSSAPSSRRRVWSSPVPARTDALWRLWRSRAAISIWARSSTPSSRAARTVRTPCSRASSPPR